jgi:anthranilate synthase component 1
MLLEATPATTQTTPALAPGATVIREISADLETPISVYMKLRGEGASFLLESVEGGERIARYSFIGIKPKAQYIIRANEIEIAESDLTRVVTLDENVDPTYFLQEEMNHFNFKTQAGVPRFIGGLVGYLGYESVRFFEPTLKS